MERITQLIADLTEYDSIAEGLKAGKSPVEVTGLAPIHKANLTAALAGQLHKQAVVICADDKMAAPRPIQNSASVVSGSK